MLPIDHDLALVLLVHVANLVAQLALETLEPRPRLAQLVLEPEDRLDTGEVEPELGRKPLDEAEPLEIGRASCRERVLCVV